VEKPSVSSGPRGADRCARVRLLVKLVTRIPAKWLREMGELRELQSAVADRRVSDDIENIESRIQTVAQSVSALETLRPDVDSLKTALRKHQGRNCLRFTMKEPKSNDGIIAYLTTK
jgi:hypothetical protein